ncbi:TPA: hypothetical protein ACH3X2_004582 [Trebouxia sp. C0005]
MGVGKLGLGALAAVGGVKAGKRAWDTLRQNRRVHAQQSELQDALEQVFLLSERVDGLQAEKAAAKPQSEDALLAAIASQKDAERRLSIMLARAEHNNKIAQTEQRLKKELIKMQVTSQLALSNSESWVQQLEASLRQREAQMAANEQGHASQIKSWQTRLEAEEELTERMASRLRTDLEEKNQQLKKEQEVGSSWSKQLLQSLVLRYSERMEHEEHMQQLNIKWMEKQRRWDLTADSLQDEKRAREEAEARVATMEARLTTLEAEKVAEAEKHSREMRTLESNLNAAHAGKQVLEVAHEEVKGSLLAAEASKTAVLRKLERQSSSMKDSIKAEVEAETKELASKVLQVKKERADMQQSKAGLAEEYSKEKKRVKSLQAQLAKEQKEKVDLLNSHKVTVSALRDEIHVLTAKQEPIKLAVDSPKKSKPAKKKAPAAQAFAVTNPPITVAEPASAGKAARLLNINIPTSGPADGSAGVSNTMEAVPGSPGPSVAPPSPDAVERSSRRGWRGVDLSSQDDTAMSASANWDEPEWQMVPCRTRGFQRAFSRSGGRHQHQA